MKKWSHVEILRRERVEMQFEILIWCQQTVLDKLERQCASWKHVLVELTLCKEPQEMWIFKNSNISNGVQ